MEKKSKELHYKRAVLHGTKDTLQHALDGVLKEHKLPLDRLEKLGLNGDEGRVIVHEHHHKAILCATMSTYEKGALQPIMGIAPKSADWPIQLCQPPKMDGANETEFLDGYLFLGVWKNHVVFLPSRSCTSEHLEDYLNCLLRKKSLWPEGALVSLDDRPPKEIRDKKFQHVQTMTFNTTLGSSVVDGTEPATGGKMKEVTQSTVKTVHFKPRGPSWDALKKLIGMFGGKLPEDVLLDNDFDPDDVSVKVEVTCSKRKLEKAGPIMDVMANALRHVQTDLVKFKFEDGTELKGSDLKTKKPFRMECTGSMPVPQQVDKAIETYLQELIEQGTVSAEE
jgi:hypothetical protein